MTFPSTIRNSFDAAAGSYDQRDGVQPEVVRRLAELLPEKLADSGRILEVGCGTGALTEVLRARYPQAHLAALDLAPAMLAAAQRRLAARFGAGSANVQWHVADVRAFEPSESFDLIASSSALHWVRPLPEVFTRLAGWLAPGGQLACALMTEGTLAELREVRRLVAPHKSETLHELPDGQAVASAAYGAGLQVVQASEREVRVRMRSALDLMRMLAAQGTAAGFYGADSALNRTEMARLLHAYDQTHAAPGGGVAVTWRVLYLKAVKP
jgi:malonyl-CoA O-methyltransferase